ncbi:Protein piccolo [Trichinella papuae]|uniref:Protein piccolo n=1 Tax=Trichinella papuae TaxID=268474 RepID=A0A0V1N395_9BILA|nr:Protein piccolo [Trichinella papuae]
MIHLTIFQSIRFAKTFHVNDALANLTTSPEKPAQFWSESEEDMDIFKITNTDKNVNIGCGDVGQFNLTEEDYFYGRHSFPWTVIILKHQSPLVHCLGILIQSADIQQASNWTQFVLTSSECFGYKNHDSEREKKLFYVYIGKYNPRNVSEMIKNSLKIEDIKVYKDSTSDPHITLLKLKTPAILNKNRHPVCLIETNKLHLANKCFVSGYNMKNKVVTEYPANLIFEFPCTHNTFRILGYKRGLCSEVKRLRNVKHNGAGLTCFINGKAHLYGIFSHSFFALTRDRVGLFAEYFTSRAFAKDLLKHPTNDNYKNGKHTCKLIFRLIQRLSEMEVQFDFSDEYIHKALTKLYPNHPKYNLLQDIPTADNVGHLVVEKNENISIACTAIALLSPKTSETLILLTGMKCLQRRRLPDMIAFFTGFEPTSSGEAAAALIRVHSVNSNEIGNGNLGFLILQMSKSISKRENTSYPRTARPKEHLNGVDSCYTTGLDERGIVQKNEVDIVTPIACEQFFGDKFDSNFMICVSEENSPITHSVGAPLICKKHNVEIIYGMKLALSTEYENENNATASAYLNIATALQPFPWTVYLKTTYMPTVECVGVLIQLAQIQKASNRSDLVLTSVKCIGYQETPHGRSKIPLTVLQLSLPVTFNTHQQPICLKEEIPIYSKNCFVSGFNSKKYSLGEYPIRLNGQLPCTKALHSRIPDISAKQGAPLTCFVNGIGYLYGIYVTRITTSARRYIINAKCFDTEEEDLRKALSSLYPNHPPFTISTDYLPSTIAHVLSEKNQNWSIKCTGMFIFTEENDQTSKLITSSQCFPRRIPLVKFVFTGFHSEDGELPKTMLLKIKSVNHIPFKGNRLPVNRVGIANVELYNTVKCKNKSIAARPPHYNEELTGVEYCLLGGINEQGNTEYVEVTIVTEEACKIVFGSRFHNEYMICGLEPKNNLTHTIGAPLICRNQNQTVHMGIKIKLGVENKPYEDNDVDISAMKLSFFLPCLVLLIHTAEYAEAARGKTVVVNYKTPAGEKSKATVETMKDQIKMGRFYRVMQDSNNYKPKQNLSDKKPSLISNSPSADKTPKPATPSPERSHPVIRKDFPKTEPKVEQTKPAPQQNKPIRRNPFYDVLMETQKALEKKQQPGEKEQVPKRPSPAIPQPQIKREPEPQVPKPRPQPQPQPQRPSQPQPQPQRPSQPQPQPQRQPQLQPEKQSKPIIQPQLPELRDPMAGISWDARRKLPRDTDVWSDESEENIFENAKTVRGNKISCGDFSQYGITADDYFYAREAFPWSALIVKKGSNSLHCLATIIQYGNQQKYSNNTDIVATSSTCIGYNSYEIKHEHFVFSGRYDKNTFHQTNDNRQDIQDIIIYSDSMSNPYFTVLRLKNPIIFNLHSQPACLLPTNQVYQPERCFVNGFNLELVRVAEFAAVLTAEKPCTRDHYPELGLHSGICAHLKLFKHTEYNGGALTCIHDGKAYLYGTFSTIFPHGNGLFKMTALIAEYYNSKKFAAEIQRDTTEISRDANNYFAESDDALAGILKKLYPTLQSSKQSKANTQVFHLIYDDINRNFSVVCTATAVSYYGHEITTDTLITSSPCTRGRVGEDIYVFPGFSRGGSSQMYRVKDIIVYEPIDEHMKQIKASVALLKLFKPITIEPPAKSLFHTIQYRRAVGGRIEMCYVYGLNKRGAVDETPVRIVAPEGCESVFSGKFDRNHMICVSNPSTTLYKTIGAPLICDFGNERLHIGSKLKSTEKYTTIDGKEETLEMYISVNEYPQFE